jgi:DNA (cytosine-5)-methyltransferase 1
MKGRSDACSLDRPTPTITAHAQHICLAHPWLIAVNHGPDVSRVWDLGEPLRTLTGKGTQALIQGFTLGQQSQAAPRSVDDPLSTIAGAGAISLTQGWVVPNFGERDGQAPRVHSLDAPLPTPTGHGAGGLAQGYLTAFRGGADGHTRVHSLEEPLRTLDTSNRYGLVTPDAYLAGYYGTGHADSLDEPIGTLTTHDRYGLVAPQFALVHPQLIRAGAVEWIIVGWLDILFRMLDPDELAAAMGFPRTYFFFGSRADQVKQIGNSVHCDQAEALCRAGIQAIRRYPALPGAFA